MSLVQRALIFNVFDHKQISIVVSDTYQNILLKISFVNESCVCYWFFWNGFFTPVMYHHEISLLPCCRFVMHALCSLLGKLNLNMTFLPFSCWFLFSDFLNFVFLFDFSNFCIFFFNFRSCVIAVMVINRKNWNVLIQRDLSSRTIW